ncbi:sporulation protein YqfD [Calidifontibacillus erzurumensis]|uniref:Sporulation protein YqfD n=1 Tax=Calidifontibacillus erzurumensis TaxID=2741433 RepID=A0A8J8K9Z5_9BACI|nr:sporulation protein YqfD [Calidifontibacillus erzurumensis]NSL50289.1 sporulation protein YqfD [Calidifontibacillus erzurumensis]
MKNQWTNFFSGYVKIKVTGKLIEPFLNHCVKENLRIWNLKRINPNSVTGYLMLEDIPKIRKIIRKSECKLEFIGRRGIPFLLKKMISNSGFIIGLLAAVFLILFLSNIVWSIEITGANPKLEHDIRKELSAIGIKRGKLHFSLPTNEQIQSKLMERIPEITWVGVQLNGTSYHFEVVEKKVVEEPAPLSPRHLVAKKKAVIYDYFVEQGQPVVKINDFVRPGQILVSGIIGKEGKTELTAAKGKIFGEIWYKSHITVPLETEFHVFTGKYMEKYYLNIFNFSIPLWGFKKVEFSNYKIENIDKQIKFLKWNLPIVYRKQIIREEEKHLRKYDQKTAIQVAKKTAIDALKAKLDEDAVIKGENVLHQKVDNGKLKLMIHYQVIEDIAIPQPIVQGD